MSDKRFGRVLLLSGGRIDLRFVAKYLESEKFEYVVCADSGLDAAYQLGIKVDYIMGDFDSVPQKVLTKYQDKRMEESIEAKFIQYPTKKDATDTHLALEWIVAQSPSEIVILGATGGRLDHLLANIQVLQIPMKAGIPAYIIDANNRLFLTDRNCVLKKSDAFGTYISLQPFTERVEKVTLRGFEYPLYQEDLSMGDSRGVSNEFAAGVEEAEICFEQGVLLVIESKD